MKPDEKGSHKKTWTVTTHSLSQVWTEALEAVHVESDPAGHMFAYKKEKSFLSKAKHFSAELSDQIHISLIVWN